MLAESGWFAGVGAKKGVDAREIRRGRVDRDLGRQSGEHPGQRHDPHRQGPQGARRQAGGGRPLPQRHRRAGGPAPGREAGDRRRARRRRDPHPLEGGLRGPGLSRPPYRLGLRRGRGPLRRQDAGLGGGHHRRPGRTRSRPSPGSTAPPSAATSGSATASRARATGPRASTRSPACRR